MRIGVRDEGAGLASGCDEAGGNRLYPGRRWLAARRRVGAAGLGLIASSAGGYLPLPLSVATAAAGVDGLAPPDPERIGRLFERIAADSDVVLVEGAGGLAVPLTWNFNYADLAAALGLEIIVVVANRLGCLNSTVLSIDYATRRHLRVRGYILNDTEPVSSPAARSNAESLRHLTDVPALGFVRYKEPLVLEIVTRLLDIVGYGASGNR